MIEKISKILIVLSFGLVISGLILFSQSCNTTNPPSNSGVDTTKYTDVVLINHSELDSVQVYLTLQAGDSIDGLFGMTGLNEVSGQKDVGMFWAKKGVEYHLGRSLPTMGAIVTWGVQNRACPAAQTDTLYKFGINNFEFSVNCWWVNDSLTGSGESFDITCVDGLHSLLKQSVTSFGPRNSQADSTHPKGLHHNFGAFWDFGYKDETNKLVPFISSQNGINFDGCINLPGIYPYGCDWGYKSHQPPTPCNNPSYLVKCSTKFGNINTSQTNRAGQGGRVTCEFFGFTRDAQPALK